MSRASLAVEATLADELWHLAKERNMTLYALTNHILENAISLMKEGTDISVLRELWQVHKALKDVDAVVLPSDFMDDLLETLYRFEGEELLKRFHKLGQELGQYLRFLADDLDQLLGLAQIYMKFLPVKRIESMYIGDGLHEIRLVGVGGRIESTMCVFELIKGILKEYDASLLEENVSKGIIRLKVKAASGR